MALFLGVEIADERHQLLEQFLHIHAAGVVFVDELLQPFQKAHPRRVLCSEVFCPLFCGTPQRLCGGLPRALGKERGKLVEINCRQVEQPFQIVVLKDGSANRDASNRLIDETLDFRDDRFKVFRGPPL